jgi:hypothetical protein
MVLDYILDQSTQSTMIVDQLDILLIRYYLDTELDQYDRFSICLCWIISSSSLLFLSYRVLLALASPSIDNFFYFFFCSRQWESKIMEKHHCSLCQKVNGKISVPMLNIPEYLKKSILVAMNRIICVPMLNIAEYLKKYMSGDSLYEHIWRNRGGDSVFFLKVY